jgi:peptidoglycan/LPS O-acetylase OafA/YrhL
VVLYHAFPGFLGSGYVGVDVFFVISGYLIGGLITAELAAGTFTFRHFYARRVRRIFPALLVVLMFVLFVGWNVMFPEEFALLGRHVFAAARFVSNFPLMGEIGYFGPDGHSKPLLHLWSLGIEEQFYVVWPLLAVLTRKSRRAFLILTVLVAVASFALSVTSPSPGLAFYQPWTRFWELTAGVLVAHLPPAFAVRWRAWRLARTLGCIVGVALILIAATASDLKGFPGWWAAVPVGGAALVIASGPDTVFSRWVLASPPMVFIGKISYPLYLWHWPLLAFTWIACGSFPPPHLIQAMVGASFVLAWLTYVLIERPARFGIASRWVVGGGVTAMIVLGVMGYVVMNQDGVPDRRVVDVNRQLMEDTRTPMKTRVSDGSCVSMFGLHTEGSFACQVNSPKPEMLILGDSVAMAFHSAISARSVSVDAVLTAVTADYWGSDCGTSEPLESWSNGGMVCQTVVKAALSILDRTPSIKVVVVSAFLDNSFFNDPRSLRALQQAVEKRQRKLVLVTAAPAFYHTPEGCRPRQVTIAGLDLTARRDLESCEEERSLIETSLGHQRIAFSQFVKQQPSVYLFDSLPAFCDQTICHQWDDRGPLYWSWGHVNERGSARLLDRFLPWLRTTVLKE